ncbi:MAG: hypothetical protein JWN25_2677 [Verrucomicrobiales bacterium]|nr:hypothetical protein [Verrucomicrobiales bacterium]
MSGTYRFISFCTLDYLLVFSRDNGEGFSILFLGRGSTAHLGAAPSSFDCSFEEASHCIHTCKFKTGLCIRFGRGAVSSYGRSNTPGLDLKSFFCRQNISSIVFLIHFVEPILTWGIPRTLSYPPNSWNYFCFV